MEGKIRRLKNWKGGNSSNPYRLEIHPTNRCNLKCRMCGTRAAWREEGDVDEIMRKSKERELSDKRLLDLIDEAHQLGVEKILLTGGGEPFIRKELTLKIMEKIKEYKIFGNINTNGTLLEEEDIKRIVDMNWDLVMFSIDAASAAVHDFIRNVPGTFQKSMESLLNFKRIKDEQGLDKPEVVFNTVLTEKNYRTLSELVELAKIIDCNDITLIPLIDSDKYPELKIKDKKDLKKKLKKTESLAERYTLHNNIEDVLEQYSKEGNKEEGEKERNKRNGNEEIKFSEIPCFEPFLNLVVKMDGEVTPCCMIEGKGVNAKRQTLGEIWNGKYYKKLRTMFRKNKIPESCSKCVLSKEKRNKELRNKLRERTK